MTCRECVLKAVTFDQPDRVPVSHAFVPAARVRHGRAIRAIERQHPSDFGGCGARCLDIDRNTFGTQTDKWGCVWRNESAGQIGMVVQHPLTDWAERSTYRFPEPSDLFDFSGVGPAVERNQGEKYLMVTGRWLWQRMFWLRGFQNILLDLADERDEVLWLRDRVLHVQKGVLDGVLGFDIDGVCFLDDWGTQRGLMISPTVWRAVFKDAYRELFDMVHAAGKAVHFHTDGDVIDIVPDLQEIGADELNLEVPVMDRDALDACVAGGTCLRGGLDLQHVLAQHDVAAVRAHVEDLLRRFARPRGGYIGQIIMDATTPVENARCVAECLAAHAAGGPDCREEDTA